MKFSFKKALCIILTMCITGSVFAFPAYANDTTTDFNSLDQKKLQIAIDSLQTPLTEGTALVKDIYTHAFSYNFNIKDTVTEVLDQVFVHGYTEDEKAEDTASEGSSTVIVNVMNMIVPTLYSEIPENLSEYFEGEPASNLTSADLIVGDLLLMEASGVSSIYIYNGQHLVKLVKPSLIREDADTVLASALNADRYVVLRPSNELSAIHRTTDAELTLSDAQKAVIGTAEAYLLRGYRIQYDDSTPFTKNSYRWNAGFRTPEESSLDNISFTNCAAFTSDVYKTALGFTDVSYTTSSQIWSAYTVWRYPQDTSASIGGETDEQKAKIEADFYDNIQPGDIINIRYVQSKGGGHSMLYIGNGNIIHSGGYSYNFSTGDVTEASIKQMRVEELFDATNKRYVFSKLKSVNIVRPLKNWNGTIPENTINRITTMKGIVGEKLSSKNRFSTVNPGDEITYTFRVFNSNDEEKTLEIKDTIPENTTYVSGDLNVLGNNLSYSITVPSKETREVSYTVKINENTPSGTWITSNSATIGGVIHKTYEIPVRDTLTSAQQTAVSEAIQNNSSLASSTDKGINYINKIYKDVLSVDAVLAHDDVADIKNIIFPAIDEYTIITGVTASDYIGAYHLDSNSHYAQMLVPRMFGGRQVVVEPNKDNIIQKLEHSQFVTGDIILTESSSGTSLYMYDNGGKVLNLSTGSYVQDVDSFFDKIFANNCFAVLRPSMSDTYEYEKSQLEIYIEELKELNKTNITDDEVLEEFEAIVAGIDTYLTENATEKLSSVQQLVYDTAKTKINNYKNPPVVVPEDHITAKGKIWFALGGNSRFFVKTDEEAYLNRANYQSFLPGVDFAGHVASPTGFFATDQAAITLPGFGGSMLAYTVNENPSNVGYTTIPDFTLEDDGNYYWTIKGTPYLIRPANNVIKLLETAPNTNAINDQAIKDRYASLTSTTIDVPDKKYESLGFLAACVTAYRKYYKITLYYADGTEDVQVEEINATYNPNSYTATYKDGQAYLANFLDTSNQRDSRFGFVPWDVDIDSSKVITKVKFEIDAADTNTTRAGHIISAWGVPVDGVEEPQPSALDTLVTELEALNNAGITSDSALSAVEAKVAEIDSYLSANTDAALTATQQTVYDTAKANIKAYKDAQTPGDTTDNSIYANGKIWFDLDGNSRLFVPSTDEAITNRANYTGYLPGVDFAGYLGTPTGNFATDQAAVINSTYGGAMFVYNTGGSTSYINLTTDEEGNYYWTVNNEKYLVRPQQNILKFVNQTVSTSSLKDNEKISRYQSLNGEQTIDVPDKKYSSIGFLGGAQLKYSKQIRVTLVYGDEEVAYGNVTHKYAKTTVSGTDGTIYMRNFTHSNDLYDAAYDFQVQTITTDPTKVLTAIKVYDVGLNGSSKAGNQSWPYYIISAWGVEKEVSLEELISELSALNALGIKNNASYSAIKAKIAEIDKYLTENSQTLTDEQKAVYDTTTALIKAYEESSASSNDSLKANISLAFNGNSKLFMDSTSTDFTNRDSLTNYLPGLDYGGRIVTPTGDFTKDLAALDLRSGCEKLGCLPYVLDSTSVSDSKNVAYFTTKGGSVYWTIDDIDYLVKPNERVIKLVPGVQTTSVSASETLTDADKANYSALAKAIIDVPDGKYEKISFLASIFRTYNRYVTIKFIYEDSEVEIQQKIEAKDRSTAGTYYSYQGGLYFPRMNEASATLGNDDWHTFVPYELTTNASKILKSIEITPSNDFWSYTNSAVSTSTYTYPVFIISMWAEQSIEGALAAITAKSSYEDALAAIATVDKILAENNLTTSNISASAKLNYDLAKSIVGGAADIFELSIKQANEAMSKITANSSLEEAKAAEKLYLDTLSIEGIEEDDFDAAIVANFYNAYLAIRQNTKLTAEVKAEYYTGALPIAKITVNNIAALAGKKFTLILTYFDKNGNQIAVHTKNYTTTDETQQKITFTPEKSVDGAVAVKAMVWESFSSMKPISEADYTERTEKRTYMFVGDSITHADQYPTYTESFFMTRFPNQIAEFVNAGRAGGTAAGAVNNRYEWDIKPNDATHAVIMFGMNDIGRTNYGEGNEEITANKQVTIDNCVNRISELAELLEADGADITLMTPSIYDERAYSTTTNLIGANTALGKVAEGAKNLAALKNYSVIDNHSLMNTINALYETSGVAEMIGSDRVHPNSQGAYVIAYNVIKTLFPNSGLVASVDINAINKSANTENADIEDLVASTNGLTYTYIPKALPWAVTDAYTKADGKYVNLTDELNREIIKATGLEEGTYTLKIDGEVIGEYTNTALAEGVNIAINAKNPGQIQAKEVYNLNDRKHTNVLELRNMALVEDALRNKGVYGDEAAANAYISTLPTSTYLYEYYTNYFTYLASVPTWKENIEKYTEQAREKSIPKTHKVEIVKK